MILPRLTLVLIALLKIHGEVSLPFLYNDGLQWAPSNVSAFKTTSLSTSQFFFNVFSKSTNFSKILSENNFRDTTFKEFTGNWIKSQKDLGFLNCFKNANFELFCNYRTIVFDDRERENITRFKELQELNRNCAGIKWYSPKYLKTFSRKKGDEASFKQKMWNLIGCLIGESPDPRFILDIDVVQHCLLLSNDVEMNPGPNSPTPHKNDQMQAENSKLQEAREAVNVENATTIQDKHEDLATHTRSGGTERAHGDEYHHLLVMFLIINAHVQKLQFKIAIEYKPAGKFDDIFFQFQNESGEWEHYFFQVKHFTNPLPDLKLHDFISTSASNRSKKPLLLNSFFESYIEVRKILYNQKLILFTNKNICYDEAIGDFIFSESIFKKIFFSMHKEISFLKFIEAFQCQKTLISQICGQVIGDNTKTNLVKEFFDCLHIATGQMPSEELKKGVEIGILKITKDNKLILNGIYDRFYAYIKNWFNQSIGTVKNEENFRQYFSQITNDPCISLIYHLRAPLKDFIGRSKELRELQKTNETKIFISGISGIGKTQLVLKYLNNNMAIFTHIFWINAGTHQYICDDFEQIAIRLGLTTNEEKCEMSDLMMRIYNFFKGNDKCIFIFDGADCNIDEIKKYIPKYKMKADVKFIVTSRESTPHTMIKLDVFSEEESCSIFTPELQNLGRCSK